MGAIVRGDVWCVVAVNWFLSEFAWATRSGPQKLIKTGLFPFPRPLALRSTPADIMPISGVRGISSPARISLRSAILMRYGILRSLTPLPRSFVRRVSVDPSPTSSEGLWEGW